MHPIIFVPIIAVAVVVVVAGSKVFRDLEESRVQDQRDKEERLRQIRSCKNQEIVVRLVLIDTAKHSRKQGVQIPPRFDIVNEEGKKLGTSIETSGINIVFDVLEDEPAYAIKKWWIKNGSPTLSWEIHL